MSQPLDFEKKQQFGLRLQVENVHINPRFFSMGPFRDEASVKITVEDVDEPPVFERPGYIMEVKEDAARNTIIGSVSASDHDGKRSPIRSGSPRLARSLRVSGDPGRAIRTSSKLRSTGSAFATRPAAIRQAL